jgi:hypothetical protein
MQPASMATLQQHLHQHRSRPPLQQRHVAVSAYLCAAPSSCTAATVAPFPQRWRRQFAGRTRTAPRRAHAVACRAERKEYYDFKDMPPLPVSVKRIYVPSLDYVIVDKASEERRLASLAIFYDIFSDEQYGKRLTRKSAITALCMYDRDDVLAAEVGYVLRAGALQRSHGACVSRVGTVQCAGTGEWSAEVWKQPHSVAACGCRLQLLTRPITCRRRQWWQRAWCDSGRGVVIAGRSGGPARCM